MPPPSGQKFNPPPGWPPVEPGWTPPPGWQPPADFPPAPPNWQWYVPVKKRSFVRRHKILTGLAAVVGLFVVLAIVGAIAGPPPATRTTSSAATGRPATVASTQSVSPSSSPAAVVPTVKPSPTIKPSPVAKPSSPAVAPSEALPSIADLYHTIPQADGAAVLRYMSNAYSLTISPTSGGFNGGEADGGNGATTSLTAGYNTSADGQTFEIECDYVGQPRTSAEVAAFMGDCAAHITYSGAKPTVARGWVMQALAAQHSASQVLTIGSATFEIPASAAPTLTRLDVHGPPA